MIDLPEPVVHYVCTLMLGQRSPAYLQVSKEGDLLAWNGALSDYGLHDLKSGRSIIEFFSFLEGIFPLKEGSIFFPDLQVTDDVQADMHIFAGDQRDWILMLGLTSDQYQRTLIQQKVNDLSLLRQLQAKQVRRSLHSAVESNPLHEVGALEACNQPQEISVLVAGIGTGSHELDRSPTAMRFKALDTHFSLLTPPILDAGGVIHTVLGHTLIALFGLLPSTQCAAIQAVNASLRIMNVMKTWLDGHTLDRLPVSNVGIFVASGLSELGIVHNGDHRLLNVIGPPMDLALQLTHSLCPWEILIDLHTFQQLEQMQAEFTLSPLVSAPMSEPLQVYSHPVQP